VPYNETMAVCRLGFDNFHVSAIIPENIPVDYAVVRCACPCGEYTMQFCMHRTVLYHLMESVPRDLTRPIMRRLRRASTLEGVATIEACREIQENEKAPKR
jgi:hypothetical protein